MCEKQEKIGIDAFVYAIYCALIPFNMIFNFTGSTINKYVGIGSAILIVFRLVASNKKTVTTPKTVLIIVLFWFWCFCTYFWSIDQETTLSWLITLTSVVALCIVCYFRGFNAKELKMIKYAMMLSAAILVMFLAPNLAYSYTRGTLTSSAGTADQNSLAANLLFSLWIATDLLQSKNYLNKIICYASIISILVGMLFLASRGAILALFISAFVYIFVMKKVKLNATTIILLIVAGFALIWLLGALEIVAYERLTIESMLEDAGTGRFDLWRGLFELLSDGNILRTLLGYGFATDRAVSYMAIGVNMGAHSVFIEYLMTTGIVGEILLLLLFGSAISASRKRGDNLSVLLLITLIAVCAPLGFFLDKGAWNIIMLSLIGAEQKRKIHNLK